MDYIMHLSVLVGVYAILGLSLNLVVGYSGLLSLAHAAFYGVGAYGSAILMKDFGFSFLSAVVLSVLITMAVGVLIGLVLSKFDGDYYALASLGFSVIAFGVFLNWRDLTNGAFGIFGIPKPEIFGYKFLAGEPYAFLVLLAVIFTFLICYFVVNSSFGRVLKAIREDEKALQVFGYKTTLYKLAVFVISAGLAGFAGTLYGSYISFIDPGGFDDLVSVNLIVVVILGGLASLNGSLLGAAFFVLLPELLRFVGMPDSITGQMRQMIYGLGLIALMMYRPQGILGKFRL
ncbi:branched-chain amino acid ABC transporter permease [Candidatus Uhrbacteria bacterium]|jgi:branched-chain amino acid transport system permease protein|nr:branched-chain amino acid ABC transporter permease [Candidatus Uhrbacteria bacterium]